MIGEGELGFLKASDCQKSILALTNASSRSDTIRFISAKKR